MILPKKIKSYFSGGKFSFSKSHSYKSILSAISFSSLNVIFEFSSPIGQSRTVAFSNGYFLQNSTQYNPCDPPISSILFGGELNLTRATTSFTVLDPSHRIAAWYDCPISPDFTKSQPIMPPAGFVLTAIVESFNRSLIALKNGTIWGKRSIGKVRFMAFVKL